MSATPHTESTPSGRNILNVALWIAQVLLCIAFAFAGLPKLTKPLADLAPAMTFVAYTPPGLVRFIGLVELLGAIGVLLPSVTRIKPWLSPLAALGLLTVMVLATATLVAHHEAAMMIMAPVILGTLAGFVAWGRGRRSCIAPRFAAQPPVG
ncbi:MAG: hypothetical protein JWM95_346 [Gemmatimonadetes bacterium]|nr:hypothetical protein [Gemmatimonadota bacterium]